MRNRMIVFLVLAAAFVVGIIALARRGEEPPNVGTTSPEATASGVDTASGLETRIATAGAVNIVIEPLRIDASGAVFRLSLDTHSEELAVDLEREATLVVDGVEWPATSWRGDPPGGHHRGGELTFEPGGSASGEATLTIGGLSEPVEATWTLGS